MLHKQKLKSPAFSKETTSPRPQTESLRELSEIRKMPIWCLYVLKMDLWSWFLVFAHAKAFQGDLRNRHTTTGVFFLEHYIAISTFDYYPGYGFSVFEFHDLTGQFMGSLIST